MRLLLLFTILILASNISAQDQTSFSDKIDLILELGIGIHSEGRRYSSQHIRADYEINEKIKLGSGIGYDIYKLDCNDTNSSVQEAFSFNDISSVSRLRPKSGHYVSIPLNFSYNFRPSTKFEIGLTNNFFVGAKGNIVSDDFFDFNSFFIFREDPLLWIEPYGFRKYFTGIHFNSSFYSKKGWGLKLGFFQAVTSLAKDKSEIPSGENLFKDSDKPRGISFHLIYRFF